MTTTADDGIAGDAQVALATGKGAARTRITSSAAASIH